MVQAIPSDPQMGGCGFIQNGAAGKVGKYIFYCSVSFFLDYLTLDGGTYRLYRNNGDNLPVYVV